MKITATNDKSVVQQLGEIINKSLPMSINTGRYNDVGTIHTCLKSKGKAVLFSWRKAIYRLTENLKVLEIDFTNTPVVTENSMEAEAKINAVFAPIEVPQVKVAVETAVETVETPEVMA